MIDPQDIPSIGADALLQLFPFGLVVDGKGQIVLLGVSLAKALKKDWVHQSVEELFSFMGTRDGPVTRSALWKRRNQLIVVRAQRNDQQVMTLRGQAFPLVATAQDSPVLLCLSLWVTEAAQVNALGLSLADFPGYDPVIDLLQMVQASKDAHDDAKELAEKLRQRMLRQRSAQEAAEAAGRSKSEFLATMSHEIRTPMNGVLGFLSLLKSTELDDKQKEFVDVALQSGSVLLSVVNDILDYSKIEAGKLVLDNRAFEPKVLIASVARLLSEAAEKKQISLQWSLGEDLPSTLGGDQSRLRQVLLNLVGNALKFTPDHGEVRVTMGRDAVSTPSAELQKDGLERCAVVLEVRDSGIGINDEQLGRLFQPFTQADASTNRKYGGTGLGLAICRRLVEAMSGSIECESQIGMGSTFRVRLPLRVETQSYHRLKSSEPPLPYVSLGTEELSILLVEDNRVNQKLARHLLVRLNCRVDLAEDGLMAVERACKQSYDAIFMDVQMPCMDGFEATLAIRKYEDTVGREPVPIIALTADALREQQVKATSAGMNAYLTKPINAQELNRIIVSLREGSPLA